MRPCLLIPVFNHAKALEATVAKMSGTLPCLVIDDGSDASNRMILARIASDEPWITCITREHNEGKGAAVKYGLAKAAQLGYTHALQIDADGQHDLNDLDRFIAEAERAPDAFITGVAQFDGSVPLVRKLGRELTHFWVRVNTLSHDIGDSMCGFRMYPLVHTLPLLAEGVAGNRMEFDSEILVKAHWRGLRIVNVPTAVRYPIDGTSHFRMLRDNLLITAMHVRCFFGMLLRLPTRVLRGRTP